MAIVQNNGTPVPKGGLSDERKYDMSLKLGLGNRSGAPGASVGSGSGVINGYLGGKNGKKAT
jgi:hypothetical protein